MELLDQVDIRTYLEDQVMVLASRSQRLADRARVLIDRSHAVRKRWPLFDKPRAAYSDEQLVALINQRDSQAHQLEIEREIRKTERQAALRSSGR